MRGSRGSGHPLRIGTACGAFCRQWVLSTGPLCPSEEEPTPPRPPPPPLPRMGIEVPALSAWVVVVQIEMGSHRLLIGKQRRTSLHTLRVPTSPLGQRCAEDEAQGGRLRLTWGVLNNPGKACSRPWGSHSFGRGVLPTSRASVVPQCPGHRRKGLPPVAVLPLPSTSVPVRRWAGSLVCGAAWTNG